MYIYAMNTGAIVGENPPSFFQRHKIAIIAGSIFFAIIIAISIVLLVIYVILPAIQGEPLKQDVAEVVNEVVQTNPTENGKQSNANSANANAVKQNSNAVPTNAVKPDPRLGLNSTKPVANAVKPDPKTTVKNSPAADIATVTGVQNAYICNGKSLDLACPVGKVLSVKSAMYGRTINDICPNPNDPDGARCIANPKTTMSKLSELINGKNRISQVLDEKFYENDPCPAISKYTKLSYECI